MGLSETEEQPRAAKEEKREGKRKTWMCTQAWRKRRQCEKERRGKAQHLLHCLTLRLLKNRRGCSFSPHCHDTVADKSHSMCTMGGFGMVVNLIDKAEQWHNACRPFYISFCVITIEGVKQSKVRLPDNLLWFWVHNITLLWINAHTHTGICALNNNSTQYVCKFPHNTQPSYS